MMSNIFVGEQRLEQLPADLTIAKLGEILTLEYGSALKEDIRTGDGYPVIGSSGVIGYHNKFLVNGPGIIVGRKGTIGGLTYMRNNFWPIDTAYFVKPKIEFDWQWMFFYLSTINFKRLSLSDVVPGLKRELVYNLNITLPSLSEQKAIAEILSTVDDAIQKSDEVINRTECIKSAVMKKLLSEGIGHTEFNETKLGKIPKEWQVVKLNEVGIFQYGYTASSQIEDTGTKFLRITDIDERGNVNWEEVPYCKISNQEFSKYKLYNKDILFARIGATSGKTCIIENAPTSIFASYLIRLKTNKDIYPKFLFFFTQSNFYWKQALQNREGQLKKGLNANTISNFEIQLPNLNEQKEIADIFSEIDKKVKVENIRKEKLLRIKKSLMNDLLTGKKDIGKIENLINSYK